MQGEVFAKSLRIGRDFALKNGDIPEQTDTWAWSKSFLERADVHNCGRLVSFGNLRGLGSLVKWFWRGGNVSSAKADGRDPNACSWMIPKLHLARNFSAPGAKD